MNLSNNLSKGIKNSEFSFSNKLIYSSIVSLVIIVVGLIFLLGFGFNYSFDFAGGYTMTVKTGIAIDDKETYESSVNSINEIFSKNSLVSYSVYKAGDGDDASIVINYKKLKDASQGELNNINETISAQIKAELKGENEDFAITVEEVKPSSAKDIVLNTLWVFAVAAVATCIYVFIRHKFMFALNLLIAIIHDVFMLVAIAAITRLQVGTGFFAVLGLTMVATVVMYLVNAAKIKENRVKQTYKDNSNSEIVDMSLKQNFFANLFISLLLIVCVFTLSAMGAIEFVAVTFAILGVLVVLYSQNFVVCPLWARLVKKDGFAAYSKAIKMDVGEEKKEEQEVEIISE